MDQKSKWMSQQVGCSTHADYFNNCIGRLWIVGFGNNLNNICYMADTKMSKTAIRTAWVVAFIVGQFLMFGHGFNLGKQSRMTMDSAFEIAKNQFKCEMTKK